MWTRPTLWRSNKRKNLETETTNWTPAVNSNSNLIIEQHFTITEYCCYLSNWVRLSCTQRISTQHINSTLLRYIAIHCIMPLFIWMHCTVYTTKLNALQFYNLQFSPVEAPFDNADAPIQCNTRLHKYSASVNNDCTVPMYSNEQCKSSA